MDCTSAALVEWWNSWLLRGLPRTWVRKLNLHK
jgi:hypothetical protein